MCIKIILLYREVLLEEELVKLLVFPVDTLLVLQDKAIRLVLPTALVEDVRATANQVPTVTLDYFIKIGD
jgi:hypothetical protein